MKKYLLLIFSIAILFSGCNNNESVKHSKENTEFFRSKEFHEKYKLTEVVVFSRHNIRAPLAAPGSFISRVTPYTWHDFGVEASELTEKGGTLETINGEFFRKWLVREGLFQNDEPLEKEIYFLTNSKQRTIATANFFLKGFTPTQTPVVHHAGKLNDMDPDFALALGKDITEAQWAQIKKEYKAVYDNDGIRRASMALQENYNLLADVLNLKESPAFKDGSFTGFNNHDSEILFPDGDEPRMTASINDACSIADAIILQYYEEPDLNKVAFGKQLTREQWQMFSKIIEKRDAIRFHSPFVQHYVSQRQRKLIADALQNSEHKFTYICGHDVNIFNILKSMHVIEYDIPDAIEVSTPIGSKIVFEKWTDAAGNDYIGVSHIYQTIDQLRGNISLDFLTVPDRIHLKFDGMQANDDGLYPLQTIIERLREMPSIEQ
ncbi:MAG: histidine-type phosphatase [Prevotellaceae bacterium]|nr:histidine-type phosphatase [Prevotellaceae bacterium]